MLSGQQSGKWAQPMDQHVEIVAPLTVLSPNDVRRGYKGARLIGASFRLLTMFANIQRGSLAADR